MQGGIGILLLTLGMKVGTLHYFQLGRRGKRLTLRKPCVSTIHNGGKMRKVARRNRKYTYRVGNSKGKGPLNGLNARWNKAAGPYKIKGM